MHLQDSISEGAAAGNAPATAPMWPTEPIRGDPWALDLSIVFASTRLRLPVHKCGPLAG
jgi:hypothetical protein